MGKKRSTVLILLCLSIAGVVVFLLPNFLCKTAENREQLVSHVFVGNTGYVMVKDGTPTDITEDDFNAKLKSGDYVEDEKQRASSAYELKGLTSVEDSFGVIPAGVDSKSFVQSPRLRMTVPNWTGACENGYLYISFIPAESPLQSHQSDGLYFWEYCAERDYIPQ